MYILYTYSMPYTGSFKCPTDKLYTMWTFQNIGPYTHYVIRRCLHQQCLFINIINNVSNTIQLFSLQALPAFRHMPMNISIVGICRTWASDACCLFNYKDFFLTNSNSNNHDYTSPFLAYPHFESLSHLYILVVHPIRPTSTNHVHSVKSS